jgi:nucleotide-binding universal stress UspA family protein
MPEYKTILIATDLSDPSLSAVEHGQDLAGQLGSRLVLTYVMEDRLPPMILAHSALPTDELLDQHRKHAEKALEEFVERHLSGRAVESIVRQGTPHQEVVQLAKEIRADLIVIGMHGHGFLAHALAGSTAERVLHQATCPVLVVSHPKHS